MPNSFKDEREFAYYIRKRPVTVRVRDQDETELMSGVESEMVILILNDLRESEYI